MSHQDLLHTLLGDYYHFQTVSAFFVFPHMNISLSRIWLQPENAGVAVGEKLNAKNNLISYSSYVADSAIRMINVSVHFLKIQQGMFLNPSSWTPFS